jgi:cellulose synthase/poly-beta-1,6-N-acetylglucosamine synthase-like glycosyltransferase
MDFTFEIHRKNLGKIYFTNAASVVTQDPNSYKDFVKQINRWYTGFWQCVAKHNIPWQGQPLDVEVAILALEGLFNGLLMVGFLFLIPYTLFKNPRVLLFPLSIDLFLLMIPSLLFVAYKKNLWKIFLYLPHFYLVRTTSSFIFLVSFIKTVLGLDLKMKWGKANRYLPV